MKPDFDQNKEAHGMLSERLNSIGYQLDSPIIEVTFDPKFICGLANLRDVYDQNNRKKIIGNLIQVVLPINLLDIIIHFESGEPLTVPVGWPTKKGYRSKVFEPELFDVNERLRFTDESIKRLLVYVNGFKTWKE